MKQRQLMPANQFGTRNFGQSLLASRGREFLAAWRDVNLNEIEGSDWGVSRAEALVEREKTISPSHSQSASQVLGATKRSGRVEVEKQKAPVRGFFVLWQIFASRRLVLSQPTCSRQLRIFRQPKLSR